MDKINKYRPHIFNPLNIKTSKKMFLYNNRSSKYVTYNYERQLTINYIDVNILEQPQYYITHDKAQCKTQKQICSCLM